VGKTLRKIYLASSSSWRAELLENAGINVLLAPPKVCEEDIWGSDPVETARLRARAKAQDVWRQVSEESIVVAADQVVYCDGVIFGKPRSKEEWLSRLPIFRGRGHKLTTAISIWSKEVKKEIEEHSVVYFRKDLSMKEWNAYVEYGEAAGCAGGYMVEKRGAWFIERVEGDWQNVIGLPIFRLITELRSLGYKFLDFV